jgi:hypothetical protein
VTFGNNGLRRVIAFQSLSAGRAAHLPRDISITSHINTPLCHSFVEGYLLCVILLLKAFSYIFKSHNASMGDGKEVGIHVTEYTSQTLLHPIPSVRSGREDPPPAPWPSLPVPLKETKLSKWVNIIYDVTLCGAPLLLLTKVGLVFQAAHMEKEIHNEWGAVNNVAIPPVKLTSGLINFNSQVCYISSDLQSFRH